MRYAWHVIKYILVFVANLLILLFVHSYFNMVVMIVMIVMPVISILCAFITANQLLVRFGGANRDLTVDEPFLVSVILDNDSIFPNMNVDVNITLENALFKTRGKHTLCIPAYAHGTDVVDYQVGQSLVGVLKVSADEIFVTDWMGFVRIRKDCNAERDYVVFPSGVMGVKTDMSAVSYGMNEAEESQKKGNDFSEVVDVREYQPGDKLQNIHWKLSAKKEILMVKERESMSSSRLMVLVELANDDSDVLNDVLKAAYEVAVYLLEEGVPFTYYYWSTLQGDIVETSMDSRAILDEWMEKIFYDKSYSDERYGLSMLEKMLSDDRKLIVITGSQNSFGETVFTCGSRVKGYISE
jgi:uncharacterized protein (DUF58 family)